MKTSELVKLLKRNHCHFLDHGKEHDIWYSGLTGKKIRIPRNQSQEIPKGTLKNIMKSAGIQQG